MKKTKIDETLKTLIDNEINRVWGSTANYIKSKLTNAYLTTDGRMVLFEKPRIETSFCFGYGQNGITTEEDEDRANNNSKMAKEKDVFFANNIERNYGDFDEMLKDPVIYRSTTYDTPDGNLWKVENRKTNGFWGYNQREYIELPEKDVEGIRSKLNEEKAKFVKRLETYWKKYGSSKLHVWTYLVD